MEIWYYISSLDVRPEQMLAAVRSHWGVESMHWTLDVAFSEEMEGGYEYGLSRKGDSWSGDSVRPTKKECGCPAFPRETEQGRILYWFF